MPIIARLFQRLLPARRGACQDLFNTGTQLKAGTGVEQFYMCIFRAVLVQNYIGHATLTLPDQESVASIMAKLTLCNSLDKAQIMEAKPTMITTDMIFFLSRNEFWESIKQVLLSVCLSVRVVSEACSNISQVQWKVHQLTPTRLILNTFRITPLPQRDLHFVSLKLSFVFLILLNN